ncbi:MAG: hypothetical protein AAF561_14390 [Planctomycetota bacterium]
MSNPRFLPLAASATATLVSAASASPVLIDFGNDDSFRGVSTPAPDADGNFWTSVWTGDFYTNLPDADGNATTIDIGFDSSFVGGGSLGSDDFNGPSGATQDPAATVYDDGALGLLGANEAVYDYYSNAGWQLQGLDPSLTYTLTFYGSHKFNNDNTTRYATYTDTDFTTVVDSVDLVVGVNADHNQDQVAVLTNVAPDASGIIYFAFTGANGGNGYLNAMSVAVVPEPAAATLGLLGLGAMLTRRRA